MTLTERLTAFIDWFYLKPLRAVMPRQTFRYIACGGLNFAVTTIFYWVAFNFIFAKQNLDLGLVVISPHIAALGIAWGVSVVLGFWMQKSISFRGSHLRSRTQMLRYFVSAVTVAAISYLSDKLLVEKLHIFPTVAYMIIYLMTATVNFFAQKHFTFRGAEKG